MTREGGIVFKCHTPYTCGLPLSLWLSCCTTCPCDWAVAPPVPVTELLHHLSLWLSCCTTCVIIGTQFTSVYSTLYHVTCPQYPSCHRELHPDLFPWVIHIPLIPTALLLFCFMSYAGVVQSPSVWSLLIFRSGVIASAPANVFNHKSDFPGISNVKSREDLVMSNTDLSADPFGAAPFSVPACESFSLSPLLILYMTRLVNFTDREVHERLHIYPLWEN